MCALPISSPNRKEEKRKKKKEKKKKKKRKWRRREGLETWVGEWSDAPISI